VICREKSEQFIIYILCNIAPIRKVIESYITWGCYI